MIKSFDKFNLQLIYPIQKNKFHVFSILAIFLIFISLVIIGEYVEPTGVVQTKCQWASSRGYNDTVSFVDNHAVEMRLACNAVGKISTEASLLALASTFLSILYLIVFILNIIAAVFAIFSRKKRKKIRFSIFVYAIIFFLTPYFASLFLYEVLNAP